MGQELLSPLQGTQRLRILDLCGESLPFGHSCKYIVKGKIFILGDKFTYHKFYFSEGLALKGETWCQPAWCTELCTAG